MVTIKTNHMNNILQIIVKSDRVHICDQFGPVETITCFCNDDPTKSEAIDQAMESIKSLQKEYTTDQDKVTILPIKFFA